jgi:hypothetical protein
MRQPFATNHALFFACLFGATAALSGCSPSGPTYNTVQGTVRVDGQPVEGAVIVFMPQPGSDVHGGSARTGPDGRYDVRSSQWPGLQSGSYRVMIRRFVRPDGTTVPQGISPESVECKQVIPHPYADAQSTTLTVTIDQKKQEIDFDIDTKKK